MHTLKQPECKAMTPSKKAQAHTYTNPAPDGPFLPYTAPIHHHLATLHSYISSKNVHLCVPECLPPMPE